MRKKLKAQCETLHLPVPSHHPEIENIGSVELQSSKGFSNIMIIYLALNSWMRGETILVYFHHETEEQKSNYLGQSYLILRLA